jgi:hypothetical protein
MKISALEKSADFATLDTEKLFSKLKSHEVPRKGRPNHDASLTSKALITSARVGGHDVNLTNTTVSSALEFALSSLTRASPTTKSPYWWESSVPCISSARRSPRGCFKCGDTTHFIADYPKRKKLDSSNKYDYTKQNDYSKGDDKKKYRFGDKKKKFQKIISWACAALSDFDFYSDDSFSSEDYEKVKHRQGDFTSLCLMGKSSRNISDSDFDVSDDPSPDDLSESRWAWEYPLQPR